ncbi:MAG: DUF547 domain-containing protein [Flavobacteriaceae bacterium]|nr:DUF547 domain-containing protein [Flavobacteriaceae bacterium]
MKKLITLLLFFIASTIFAQSSDFNALLQANVDVKGNVDYKSLKANEEKLDGYLAYLNKTTPKKGWSANKEKAFWINAYNAYTIKIILDNYPLKSITGIKTKGKTAWKTPFAKVGGKTYTLDHIEHQILRKKFKDARIHVGVNCASGSCPKLGNMAFTEDNIETELERLMTEFINDSTRNKIGKKKIEISEIFNWFKSDFTNKGSVIDYINKYSTVEISKKAKIKYLPYNWSLNGK